MIDLPFVSIIIPTRNEKKFIQKCLDSVIASDYPNDKIELLIVDGMSDDQTQNIVRKYAEECFFIKMLDNPKKIVPTALNIGIANSKGNIIIRMDAHATYERDYISKCVKYMRQYDVDNVGGVLITLPGSNTVIAQSIAVALSHPFGIGNSSFRIGSKEPRYTDTVPFGCFKRDVFNKFGLFDEDLVRNQDDEFNLRIIKKGGKVLLVPDIVILYHARDSLLKLWKMYYQYGYFKPLVVQKVGGVHTWRQLMPAVLVGSLLITAILSLIVHQFKWLFFSIILLYLFGNLAFSFSVAIDKGLKYLFTLPAAFSTIHFSYGIGYLKGIFDFIILKKQKKKKIDDVPLTR